MPSALDLQSEIGKRYGRLFLKEYQGRFNHTHVFLCSCDCGAVVPIKLAGMRSGQTRSCGCLARENSSSRATHGASRGNKLSPEYRAWRNMLTRAKNPKVNCAQNYIGRGISVCAAWDSGGDGKGFERFLSHIGRKPVDGYSLDRVDVNRPYEPGNVRWASNATQSRNRTDNRVVFWKGQSRTLTDACLMEGQKLNRARDRIDKLKWSLEKALTYPARADKRRA